MREMIDGNNPRSHGGDGSPLLNRTGAANSLFLSLLAEYDLEQLENDHGTIFGLWPDLTLAYTNPAWSRFAVENGGGGTAARTWTLGRSVIDTIAAPLRPFFIANYGRCLREGRPWEHGYQQTTALGRRQFHMIVFPLGQAEGLLVVNSAGILSDLGNIPLPPPEELYRNENGIISQCCHCRRIRRVRGGLGWDWIPAWARRNPERTSHGVCAACSGFYYSKARWDLENVVKPFSTLAFV